jgi:hypothetical protein
MAFFYVESHWSKMQYNDGFLIEMFPTIMIKMKNHVKRINYPQDLEYNTHSIRHPHLLLR